MQNDWYTPAPIIELARVVMDGILLDPFSNDDAQNIVKADKYGGGYEVKWVDKVWLNPPYSHGHMLKVVNKILSDNASCMLLCNFDSSTKWCQTALNIFDVVGFFEKRIKFIPGVDQKVSSNSRPQALFVRGRHLRERFEESFKSFGKVVRL